MPFLSIFWIVGGSTGLLKKNLYLKWIFVRIIDAGMVHCTNRFHLPFRGWWKRAVTGAGYLECSYTSFFFSLGFSVTAWFFKALWMNYLCSSVLLPFLDPNVDCDINRRFSWYCCLCICGTVIENIAYQKYIIDPSKLHLPSSTIIASFFISRRRSGVFGCIIVLLS